MADFHSVDGWFVWGIVTVILNLALLSGWYKLRNALYSTFWLFSSLMDAVSAILSMVLHSKLSSPSLLLATALWSLLSLTVLIFAISRSYLRNVNQLEVKQKQKLMYVRWTQYLVLVGVPFFAAGTAFWAQSDNEDDLRVYYRNVGRAVNWTGCALLALSFLASTGAGVVITYWSYKKKVPAPVPSAVLGALFSTPFVLVRFGFQMYWMRFRNTSGADYDLHVGGGVAMDLIIPTINLFFAWYTFSLIKRRAPTKEDDSNLPMHRQRSTADPLGTQDTTSVTGAGVRRPSVLSTFSTGSVSAADSATNSNAQVPFRGGFKLRTTGRTYRMESTNALVKSARRVHKDIGTISDEELTQAPFHLDPHTIRVDAQRAMLQIARLLWLFMLWEQCKGKNTDNQHGLEVDIVTIWYEDVGTNSERKLSHVHVIRSFEEIRDAVLGPDQARPVEKMLARVFLHFFEKLDHYNSDMRAAACLMAWRMMLKKDLTKTQPFESTFEITEEGDNLDIGETTWRRFDLLAAGKEDGD